MLDNRPGAAYDVRVTKPVTFTEYTQCSYGPDDERISGTFTVTFSAYNPYARL